MPPDSLVAALQRMQGACSSLRLPEVDRMGLGADDSCQMTTAPPQAAWRGQEQQAVTCRAYSASADALAAAAALL